MAKHMDQTYVSNVLFDDSDDDDEDNAVPSNTFRIRNPAPQLKFSKEEQQVTQQKIKEIEDRTVETACRSLALLRKAEDIGIQAAVELDHQGDQLLNTNTKLDGIITNLNTSQKHINGMKSVFSGIKNYVLGKSDSLLPPKKALPSKRSPVLSSRKIDNTTDVVLQRKVDNFESHPTVHLYESDGQSSAGPISSSQHVSNILDDHLNEMGQHIHNLKELGLELGKKIDEHNELISTIQDKAELADIKIGKQNKEMNKLLGK